MRNLLSACAALAALTVGATSAHAQCDVTTTFASNNGGSVGGMVYFDLNVTNATRITGFSINTTTAINTAIGLNVYTRVGSYVGQTTSIANWGGAPVRTGTGVVAGSNVPSLVTLSSPLILTPGLYGVALGSVSFGFRYTNFTALQNYVGPNYTITAGAASNTPFPTSAPFSPRIYNGTVHCTSADGLFPNFTGTPLSGPSPLNVNFTDTTYTSDPGGVTSWAWDLDGDSIVDSNAQNPAFAYTVCGRYSVTLTVTDASHPSASITKNQYVVVDPQLLVSANFTVAPSAGQCPLNAQFTDTSTGSPTSWAWDLDGDSIVDSSAQNPSFIYSVAGAYNVTLTVSNACGSSTRTVTGAVGCVDNDECTTAIPLALGLSAAYSNVGSSSTATFPCVAAGTDVWFTVTPPCNGSLSIDTCTGTNFDTVVEALSACPGGTSIACNDDTTGCSSTTMSRITFNVLGATTYYIRVGGWTNAVGTFQLNVALAPAGSGSFATVSPGCGGTGLTATGNPNIGGSATFTMAPVSGLPFINLGLFPLGVPICAGGCILGATLDATFPGASLGGPIPCDPLLVGGTIYSQGIDLGAAGGCAAGDPIQLTLSDTIRTIIG